MKRTDSSCCHHDILPEFTLKAASAEKDHMDSAQEWTRGEIRTDDNHAGWYELRCHQTLLRRIHYVSFDNHKKSMVAPDWEARRAGALLLLQGRQRWVRGPAVLDRARTAATTRRVYGCAEKANLQLRRGRDGTGDSTFRCWIPANWKVSWNGVRRTPSVPTNRLLSRASSTNSSSAICSTSTTGGKPNGVMEGNRRRHRFTKTRTASLALASHVWRWWADNCEGQGFRASDAVPVAKLAFEFLVLTAARWGEVRWAEWAEINRTEGVWTVPQTRMKAKREHRVPLCRCATEILGEARMRDNGASPMVLTHGGGNPLADKQLRGT